jgi:hypothetical protein
MASAGQPLAREKREGMRIADAIPRDTQQRAAAVWSPRQLAALGIGGKRGIRTAPSPRNA